MRRLLITGFEPFDGKSVNPSWEAVERLPEQIGDFQIRKLRIPTVYGEAARLVLEAAVQSEPHVILCVGVAAGRDAVTPERIAVNIRDARIADNAGNHPRGDRIDAEGPAAYFSTVPVEKMAQAIRDAGIPASVSNTAGTYVCNDVLYTLLHHYAKTQVQIGFIHVPQLLEQGSPAMELDQIQCALQAAILVC